MKRWLLTVVLLPLYAFAQAPAPDSLSAEAIAAFKKGDFTTSRQLFETVLSQNPRDTIAQNYLKAIAIREKGGSGAGGPAVGIEGKIRSIIIPKADFQDASVRDAITYVSQQVKSLSGGKQTMNIVWLIPADHPGRVTLSLQNIPASELMKYVAESGGVQLDYDAYAVKVKPLAANAATGEAPATPAAPATP